MKKKKKLNKKPKTIQQFIKELSTEDKKLLDEYIYLEYAPKVRTGKGRKSNFIKEHDSEKGIKIVEEILKFKKFQQK